MYKIKCTGTGGGGGRQCGNRSVHKYVKSRIQEDWKELEQQEKTRGKECHENLGRKVKAKVTREGEWVHSQIMSPNDVDSLEILHST